jgi:hypothetical protein
MNLACFGLFHSRWTTTASQATSSLERLSLSTQHDCFDQAACHDCSPPFVGTGVGHIGSFVATSSLYMVVCDYCLQQDIAQIKELVFRTMMKEEV